MKIAVILGLALASFFQQKPSVNEGSVLALGAAVEPMITPITLPTGDSYQLVVDPGVRVLKGDASYTLSTHDGSKIDLGAGASRLSIPSPSTLKIVSGGLEYNGKMISSSAPFYARRLVQDDTDSNLKSMQENAKKLKSKNPPANPNQPNQPNNNNNQGNNPTHWRLLFSENPMPTAELFNAAAIQQLSHLSPIGF